MPFWRTFYHLVWATKNREPLITDVNEAQLRPALVDKAAELGVYVHAINMWSDHVHMVVAIPPRLSVADVVGQLKGRSTHDLNRTSEGWFAWQRGYGVLTLGSKQLEAAIDYVRRQKEHHREATTMAWLERDAVEDEGPPSGTARVLREMGEAYAVGVAVADRAVSAGGGNASAESPSAESALPSNPTSPQPPQPSAKADA